jgi:hypothetical protein
MGDDSAEIGLALIVRGPTGPGSDATDYFGGVGDVLQDKILGRNVDISHLDDLASVALYAMTTRSGRSGVPKRSPASLPIPSASTMPALHAPFCPGSCDSDLSCGRRGGNERGSRIVEALYT